VSDYNSCSKTYATLRIYSDTISPTEMTNQLKIQPTQTQIIDDLTYKNKNNSKRIKINGWFLSSKGKVKSKDSRNHINWIFEQFKYNFRSLKNLQKHKCRMDISCYWLSKCGNGGPTISPEQAHYLSKANIDLWYDFYSEEVLKHVLESVHSKIEKQKENKKRRAK
jgi:hypothetical protein